MSGIRETPAPAWQPIETAPKNKTVLGFQATPGDWENKMAVCWHYRLSYGPKDGVWIGEGGLMPTHWMPLPEPPVSP